MKKATSNVEVEKTKQEMHKFAKSIEIKLVIENPSFEINYLDLSNTVTTYSENLTIKSIKLMQIPTTLQQIPKIVENRLTKNSSNGK